VVSGFRRGEKWQGSRGRGGVGVEEEKGGEGRWGKNGGRESGGRGGGIEWC